MKEPRERADGPAPEPDRPQRPAGGPALDLRSPQAVLRLSATAGNAAVARAILARHGDDDHDHAPEAGGGTATAGAPASQAAAEQEALDTWALLRAVHGAMERSPEPRIRNTGQMLDPPAERPQGRRMRVEPMTMRSDTAALCTERGEDPAETAYYFYGSHQDNEHRHRPTTHGTIIGSTVVIRGRHALTGAMRTQDDLIATLVHETSHVLVADYGEHPGTSSDAASFDRYKDEFRAYFVEPPGVGDWGSYTDPDDRADAIKRHLVGTSATEGGYPHLREAYWREPHAENGFRRQVDAHRRPDGFNLNNSPRLDRLVNLLREVPRGTSTVEDVIWQLSVIPAAERAEAAGSTLVARLVAALPGADAGRVRQALTNPRLVGYGREINPRESPRVTAVLDAIAAGAIDPMKAAYGRCEAGERQDMALNAHLIVWVDHALPDPITRACVVGMINGRSALMFDAVRDFMAACEAAAGDATLTEMPAPMRAALRRMTFMTRLSFYRMSEDAYRLKVQPLPAAIRGEVRAILRGERDP